MLFASRRYAYAIGSICGIISSMDPAGTEYTVKKDLLKTWASEMDMPPELRSQLFEYLDECKMLIRQGYYASLLELLSPDLVGKVSQHTHGVWIQAIPFFACDDEKERRFFTMAVAKCLHPKVFGKSEILVAASDPADSMYIIAKGVVAQSNGLVLCPGRYFGEDMCLRDGTHSHTYSTVTFVTVNVLSKEDLFGVLATGRFPITWRSIRKWVVRRSFQRIVRTIVHMRRSAPFYKRIPRDQVRSEIERLVKIARADRAARAAKSAKKAQPARRGSEPLIANAVAIRQSKTVKDAFTGLEVMAPVITEEEMAEALERVSSGGKQDGSTAYTKQLSCSFGTESTASAVTPSHDATDEGGAWRAAQLELKDEVKVRALRSHTSRCCGSLRDHSHTPTRASGAAG